MITIKTQKEVTSNGTLGYRVLEIKALSHSELPGIYIDEYPRCTLDQTTLIVEETGFGTFQIGTGNFYTVDIFECRIGIIKRCGEKLKTDRKILALLKAQWAGKKTFTI